MLHGFKVIQVQTYGRESERVDLHAKRRDIFLLKLSSQMPLHECSLPKLCVSQSPSWKAIQSARRCCARSSLFSDFKQLKTTYFTSTSITDENEFKGWRGLA